MRIALTAACLSALAAATPACAQIVVTGVSAALPDPNGKVPVINQVAGAGIATLSTGFPQVILTRGHAYEYCVTIATGAAKGSASVAYQLSRGAAIIQSDTFIQPSQYPVGPNGVWLWCAGYQVLPTSPGFAVLTGLVTYTPTGSTKATVAKLSVPVVLK